MTFPTMALFWIKLTLFFALGAALGEQQFSYQDIMMKLPHLHEYIHMAANISQRSSVLLDSEPVFKNSQPMTPWKLLYQGTKLAFKSDKDLINATCKQALEDTFSGLKAKQQWALRMLDSTGKPNSGILEGSTYWLGYFSECMQIEATKAEPGGSVQHLFDGQYCLATFLDPKQLKNPQALKIGVGLCIPSTCSQNDTQNLLNYALEYVTTEEIVVVTNYAPRSVPLTTEAIVVTALLSLIGFAILVGTLYDVCIHQGALERARSRVVVVGDPLRNDAGAVVGGEDRPLNVEDYTPLLKEREEQSHVQNHADQQSIPLRILLALSVYTNAQRILTTKRTPGALDCVHGIRFLSMTWVILGHTIAFLLTPIAFAKNLLPISTWLNRWTFQAIANATVSVDSFFFLSGTLVSYLLLKQLREKEGPRHINWALFYFHRFWRLTPAYMLVLGTHTALFQYWGNGPIWPHGAGVEPNCKDSWWTNFLYINNLVNVDKSCMAWCWYLANDMQFFVISPLVVVAFFYKWFVGLAFSIVLLLVTFISSAELVLHPDSTDPMASFNNIYIKPWCRVGPYAIGMILGYVLYITDRQRPRIHKGLVALGWALATACNLAVLYGLDHYGAGLLKPLPLHLSAAYTALSRTAWSVGLAWVVFACARGYGGFVNTLMSWPGLIPLSRLTYAAYLVHPIVLFYYNFVLEQTILFNEVVFIWLFLGGLAVSYGLAFVVSLAFEAPMMALEKIVFPRP